MNNEYFDSVIAEVRARWTADTAAGFTKLSFREYLVAKALAWIPPSVDELLGESDRAEKDPPGSSDEATVIDFPRRRPR